ncbi:MAG: hypothetical protein NUV74_13340 [Candidatus Brocadiaceae bacterium]|nr:hypothetical protein [Candidatus Brocadiaceae bacterium]
MTTNTFPQEKLYTVSNVLRLLRVPRYKLDYLFDSRRLKEEDFLRMPNGHKVFRESDIPKIQQALFEMANK